eukprot:TRINITY_DN1373_c0_g1_i18.p1 TRINITY_DN1373_c0_g1~~TRINITY_DN1373_c0_g1_i18.p1  ORF type:complete len:107 (-),score=18.46 TRINITY_DN1373_c0_g1_i18:571-891(-)
MMNSTFCDPIGSCSNLGNGFAFVIHNERAGVEYLGNSGSDLGYFPPVNSYFPKSLAVVFDHSGVCSMQRPMIRLVLNNAYPSSSNLVDTGLVSSNATGPLECQQGY